MDTVWIVAIRVVLAFATLVAVFICGYARGRMDQAEEYPRKNRKWWEGK